MWFRAGVSLKKGFPCRVFLEKCGFVRALDGVGAIAHLWIAIMHVRSKITCPRLSCKVWQLDLHMGAPDALCCSRVSSQVGSRFVAPMRCSQRFCCLILPCQVALVSIMPHCIRMILHSLRCVLPSHVRNIGICVKFLSIDGSSAAGCWDSCFHEHGLGPRVEFVILSCSQEHSGKITARDSN